MKEVLHKMMSRLLFNIAFCAVFAVIAIAQFAVGNGFAFGLFFGITIWTSARCGIFWNDYTTVKKFADDMVHCLNVIRELSSKKIDKE